MFAGARRDGGGQLVQAGIKPEHPLVPGRRSRRLVLPLGIGAAVLIAVIILVHASLDTDEPGQEKLGTAPAHGPLASVPAPAAPSHSEPPPSAARALPGRSSAAPAVTGVPAAAAAPVAIAPLGAAQPAVNGAAATPRPSPILQAHPAAPTPARGARSAAHTLASASADREAARAGGGSASTHAGSAPHDSVPAKAGAAAHAANPKLALQADAAKRDAVWKRPLSEEDASSKLVARFAPSGGATLKGRVVDAETGRPSVGVGIEAHIGDSFMRTVSDNAGTFKMSGMLPARRITVWIIGRSDTFVAERIDVTSPGEGETSDAGVVRLLRGDELADHLEGWMGVFVSRRGHRNVVAAVSPWSPADRAGIQVGDVLLSIEGRDVDGLGPRATGFLLRGPVGTRANIAVQTREGSVHRVQLERVMR